jgi:hypothetical protein
MKEIMTTGYLNESKLSLDLRIFNLTGKGVLPTHPSMEATFYS